MTTVQNFITWIRQRSKKHKMEPKTAVVKPSCDFKSSVCRESLKLPPIPRQESSSPICRFLTDSPAHVYEEIPAYALDTSMDNSSEAPVEGLVDIANLDFAQAKEFGAYLVVPIKDKLRSPDEESADRIAHNIPDIDPNTCDCSSDATSGFVSESTSSIYPSPSDISSSPDSPTSKKSFHCVKPNAGHSVHNGSGVTSSGCSKGITNSNIAEEDELQEFVDSSFMRLRLGNIRRSERNIRSVRFLLSDVHESRNASGHRRSICSSQISHVTGSDSSNDTCNEYDIEGGDPHDSKDSPSDVPCPLANDADDDDSSSLYALSGSDQDTWWSRDKARSHDPNRLQETDSSNDTFSEYDFRSDDLSSNAADDYEYYLSKVKKNLQFKEAVSRLIRESESEYELTSGNEYQVNSEADTWDDTNSLTTVTSMSDVSTFDLGEIYFSRDMKKKHRGKHKCRSVLSTEREQNGNNINDDNNDTNCANNLLASNQLSKVESQENCKVKRHTKSSGRTEGKRTHKKKHKDKNVEYYCIPDFPVSSHMSRSQEQLSTEEMDPIDKLSCRATNFKPKFQPKVNDTEPTGTAGTSGPRTFHGGNNRDRRQPNRLLSDLMRMNHDRLFVLF